MKKFIITGAMGAGKSTILSLLKNKVKIVTEPAREILAEQRIINGNALPEKNSELFVELMLSRSIEKYNNAEGNLVLFDRGIADNIAYAKLFGLDMSHLLQAARHYQFASPVLFFPGWEEIYSTDDERKIDFSGANKFGEELKKIYAELGYRIVNVPKISIDKRVEFIDDFLHKAGEESL